jgi:hypothetical protein
MMLHPQLHRTPVALNIESHRHLKIRAPLSDWSVAAKLTSVFVAATEFADICRECPIVFVKTGQGADGQTEMSPVAVLGVSEGENLFVDGTAWRGRYTPATLRAYPFFIARVDAGNSAVCIDGSWAGFSTDEGQGLFDAEGKPTAFFEGARKQIETLDAEVLRTRAVCQRFQALDLLRDMRFDATLPDGRSHRVDGFFTVDEKKLQELPDATVVELHKSGLLGLVHLHWVSLRNMATLLQWHVQRHPAAPAQR